MAKRRPSSPVAVPDPISGQLSGRVKVLRQQRGWSLAELSAASGVSRSMLSQIERRLANPTLAVACKIAQAFGMSLAEFVELPGAASGIQVVRGNDPAQLYRSDAACEIRTLSPLHLEKDVEIYEVRLRAGGALRSAPHYQGTREFLTVSQGKVRVTSQHDQIDLARGDSASYRADVPHAIENLGKGPAMLILVVIYQ
jgi:transcriptional regulator with XRE-family HTH domain|uniref:XRE family transcriptional regulator n=1 Tax=Schlesneria paludicola TaxID=360056 RepID=A0A7C4QR27_9PLAN